VANDFLFLLTFSASAQNAHPILPLGSTRSCEAGASITSASSSNVSTAGSGGASGRIAISVGAMLAGNACLTPNFTASTSLFVCST
jgi:hypothetical protein